MYALLQRAQGVGIKARSNMNVDGSAVSFSFFYQVPAGSRFQLSRLNVVILDSGKHARTSFGSIEGPLDPGLALCVLDASGSVKKDFTGGLNICQNSDWKLLAGVDERLTTAAGPDETAVRFTVRSAGDEMLLYAGERVEALVQNDLTGLVEFRIQIQGILYPRHGDDPGG